MTGKHHAWHKRWAVDLAARTATHTGGLLVTFTRVDDADRAWDGAVDPANGNATFAILSAQHGAGNAAAMLPRLMREAGDAFLHAHKKGQL